MREGTYHVMLWIVHPLHLNSLIVVDGKISQARLQPVADEHPLGARCEVLRQYYHANVCLSLLFLPTPPLPTQENGEEDDDEGSSFGQGKSKKETRPNLSVAQIIVTCATPMVEDAEKKFLDSDEPPAAAAASADENGENDLPEADQKPYEATKVNEKEKQVELKEQCEDDDGFGGNQFEANFEANFEDAFASQTIEQIEASSSSDKKDSPSADLPKQVVGGRASIPEELDSHQLARLQNLKESNA